MGRHWIAVRADRKVGGGAEAPPHAYDGLLNATYFEVTPIIRNHVSTRSGHFVIGYCVRRSPKPCLPSANRCNSAGTPAFVRET